MVNNKLLLRVILKLLTTVSLLWLAYVFTAGFFTSPDSAESFSKIDLSLLKNNQPTYFKINRRELLVIKNQDEHIVFWAQDPVYGCRLEYDNLVIKPVCIDIEYTLDGYNKNKQQKLMKPDYKINSQKELIIF
ncbi:MAG: hypothetical protein OQK98_00060 [Gammaproteobacteria bacterium]|nr:hypothetical protein [Gammaproteobacteria bacterium]